MSTHWKIAGKAAATRRGLRRLMVLAALSLALSAATREIAPTLRAVPGKVSTAPEDAPAPTVEAISAPSAIREAHSDGGYQYWLERQPAAAERP